MKNFARHSDPQHLQLGSEFFDVVKAASFPQAILRYRNETAAASIGLDGLSETEWIEHFARFQSFTDNIPQPIALRYHGHQFQNYNHQLGDGRGFLFAQFRDLNDGRLLDLGTKGSGTTPWSRRGDGRLTLKGAVREALATEMLEALGVTTSKTLSVIETGESLERHDEPSPTRAGVLVRLNHSHVRYGSFQRPAALQRPDLVEQLLRYSIKTYFPHIEAATRGLSALEAAALFLREVVKGAAKLCGEWMLAGFVHGVLNTDNMNITGESFDYGPYRFLPVYDPSFTAAYFDESGLYAYGRQPEIVLWNLEQLASALATLAPTITPVDSASGQMPPELVPLQEALVPYSDSFNESMLANLQRRLGLETPSRKIAEDLIRATFEFLFQTKCGFEQFFFDWYGGLESHDRAARSAQSDLYDADDFIRLRALFEKCKAPQHVKEQLSAPYFARQKPCSLLIDEIEAIWKPIADLDDWSLFNAKIDDIRSLRKLLRNEL